MRRSGWKLPMGVAACLLAGVGVGLVLLGGTRRPGHRAPPAVSEVSAPPPASRAALDLDRLYDLDFLVLEEPAPLPQLRRHHAFRAGPAGGAVAPEPGVAVLWILGIASVWTLYVPARSW